MSGVDLSVALQLERLAFSTAGLQEILRGPGMQDAVRRAIRVEAQAKEYASGTGGGPNVRTGRLRGSITWEPGTDSQGPYVDVGSNVLYAPFVERGTSRMPAYPFLFPALQAARG